MVRFADASATLRNEARGEAQVRSPREALISYVLASMIQDTFYRSGSQEIEDIRQIVAQLAKNDDLVFAMKAAIYSRHVHGLRSVTHVVAGEVARYREVGKARFYDRVVRRPDDMTEITGYILQGKPRDLPKTLPHAVKKGFARAFQRFDVYQLGKWRGERNKLKLRDVAHLVHAPGVPGSAVHQLRGGALTAHGTWERKLSDAGPDQEKKEAAWEELLAERKLGYLAAVRNARNIILQAPDAVPDLCRLLSDSARIAKAGIFPFQYLQAFEAVTSIAENRAQVKLVVDALFDAIDASVSNVPDLPGQTLVAMDDSGSMHGTWNLAGGVTAATRATLFGAALHRKLGCDLMLFSSDARYISVPAREAPVMATVAMLRRFSQPGGTRFASIFELADPYDRIFILSDMQSWQGSTIIAYNAYVRKHQIKPKVYTWDLVASKTGQLRRGDVIQLAGWTDKIFDVVRVAEMDPKALEREIEAVEL